MPKIKLGSNEKSFKHKAVFQAPNGESDNIQISYKYRNRLAYASFVEEIYPGIKNDGKGIDLVAATQKGIGSSVKYIMGARDGWDLDDEFNEVNVKLLCTDHTYAANAITYANRSKPSCCFRG